MAPVVCHIFEHSGGTDGSVTGSDGTAVVCNSDPVGPHQGFAEPRSDWATGFRNKNVQKKAYGFFWPRPGWETSFGVDFSLLNRSSYWLATFSQL